MSGGCLGFLPSTVPCHSSVSLLPPFLSAFLHLCEDFIWGFHNSRDFLGFPKTPSVMASIPTLSCLKVVWNVARLPQND